MEKDSYEKTLIKETQIQGRKGVYLLSEIEEKGERVFWGGG